MINYFAYGSNMAEHTMLSIAPSAKKIGIARLAGHRLAFTRKSTRWRAGVADVVACTGLSVYGVLYAVDLDELVSMDRKEGTPRAYRQTSITTLVNHDAIPAMTYAVTKPQAREIPPHADYFAQILQGAEENNLPEPYLAFLNYINEQLLAGTRDEGLLLTPTSSREASAGEPLIRLHPEDGGHTRHEKFAAVVIRNKGALGQVELTASVAVGTCQADQSLRGSAGVGGQHCFGHRVRVLSASGSVPRWSPVKPRALVLPLHSISRNDSEKNYCVLHPDRIRVLGLQEGEFARLFVASTPEKDDICTTVRAISIRVYSGSATEVTRVTGKVPYPDRSEVYLSEDERRSLKLPESGWTGTPVLIRPALWPALSSRAIFYGLTALLGIGALFQLLQAFEPRWPSYIHAGVALAASALVTVTMSVIDLRSRFRY